PRVRNSRVIDEFYNPRARLEQCALFHYEYLHVAARNLAVAVKSLHQRGYVIGDVKQSNILVTPNALVTLVDTDSFQVHDAAAGHTYRCPVGTPEFTPAELQGAVAPDLLAPHHDLFGLGVLIFQLLMEGSHPFAGAYSGEDDPPPLGDRIKMGWFPHDRTATANGIKFRRLADSLASPISPARRALPFGVLPPELRTLFVRCFVDGHCDPSCRPTAQEWQEALDIARAALVRCAANSHHRYAPHLSACPWCHRRDTVLRGIDPFPATAAAAKPAAPHPRVPMSRPIPPLPPRVPPMAPMPTPAANAPVARHKIGSGWGAYAIAALGLPVFLGLVTFRQAALTRDDSEHYEAVATQEQSGSVGTPAGAAPQWTAVSPEQAADRACYDLTPDGKHAAITNAQRSAVLLNTATNEVEASITTDDSVSAVAAAPDGSALAVAGGFGISMWVRRSDDSDSRMTLLPQRNGIAALRFSPDGDKLATITSDGDLFVVRVKDGAVKGFHDPTGRGKHFRFAEFSPDGRTLYATWQNGTTVLYAFAVDGQQHLWSTDCGDAWQARIAIAPDGSNAAAGGMGLDICGLLSGSDASKRVAADAAGGNVVPLCFSPDGNRVAAAGDSLVLITRIDVRPSSPVVIRSAAVRTAVFSQDGARLTTLSATNGVEEWNTRNGSRLRRVPLPSGDAGP
ncbi:MAG TPA: hypothetical protein VKT77_02985, partial [Chthonomonadaceae bacterium]|nr:hypothetical protein [Chthonomonadaceae bacterium]